MVDRELRARLGRTKSAVLRSNLSDGLIREVLDLIRDEGLKPGIGYLRFGIWPSTSRSPLPRCGKLSAACRRAVS